MFSRVSGSCPFFLTVKDRILPPVQMKWVIICYFVQQSTIVTASVIKPYRACQISSAYSLIVLSLEKNAEFAMLASDIACHCSLSE